MTGERSTQYSSSDHASDATKALYRKRKEDLVKELVDPICIISNANEILSVRLGKFVNDDTRAYFEMISRSVTKTKTLIEELRQETN